MKQMLLKQPFLGGGFQSRELGFDEFRVPPTFRQAQIPFQCPPVLDAPASHHIMTEAQWRLLQRCREDYVVISEMSKQVNNESIKTASIFLARSARLLSSWISIITVPEV
jgi:hypothetical protein